MILTEAVLAQVCPLLGAGRRQLVTAALVEALEDSTLVTAPRLAAFLAQAAHESSEFRLWTELWGPTPQQRRYEPPSILAHNLGNDQPGDGFRYRGRGPFQVTGRANYRSAGQRLDLPLEDEPDLVATPTIGSRTAVDFWETRGLTPLADLETAAAFRAITRRLNGGANGLPQREAYHAVARAVLGCRELAR